VEFEATVESEAVNSILDTGEREGGTHGISLYINQPSLMMQEERANWDATFTRNDSIPGLAPPVPAPYSGPIHGPNVNKERHCSEEMRDPLGLNAERHTAEKKKPKIWGRLKKLVLDASANYQKRGLGDARNAKDYDSGGGVEARGLLGDRRGSFQSHESLLGEKINDEENEKDEDDWKASRTSQRKYPISKRTLRQWKAMTFTMRKSLGRSGL